MNKVINLLIIIITIWLPFMATAAEPISALTLQAKLWGKNPDELAAWGRAAETAGGSAGDALGWYFSIMQQNATVGRETMSLTNLMQHIHQQVKDLKPAEAQRIFMLYGLFDPGLQSLAIDSDGNFEKIIKDISAKIPAR